jgi:hypothetical protein
MVDGVLEKEGSVRSRVRMLRLHSSEALFADLGSDYGTYHRAHLLRLYGWRAAVVASAGIVALLIQGWTWRTGVLALAACFAVGPTQVLAVLMAVALAPFWGRFWWIPLVAVMAGALYRKSVEPARIQSEAIRSWRPVNLLSARENLYLARHRLRFKVTMALDLAAAGFPLRAAEDVTVILAALGRKLPGCQSMLQFLRAIIAYESDDHSQALVLAELARQAAASANAGTRAWVELGSSRLMAQFGDTVAARAWAQSAVQHAPRRARGLQFEANLQLGAVSAALDDRRPAVEAIHRARLLSIRRRDLLGMITTEAALMRALKLPDETRAEVTEWLVDLTRGGYKNAPVIPDHVKGAAEALAGEFEYARGDRRSAADHFARGVLAFQQAREVVPQALLLARFAEMLSEPSPIPLTDDETHTANDQRDDCLEFALWAIEKFQDVRYALPTSQWRQSWIRAQARTYDLAMRAAHSVGDHAQLAALLELSKFQAAAITADLAEPDRRDMLDMLLEARAAIVSASAEPQEATGLDALRVLVSADPVHIPAPPVVAGKSALPRLSRTGTDVDSTICAIGGPNGFYLTAAVTGRHYFWAFRAPNGTWTSGMETLVAGSAFFQAIDDVLTALPVRLPGEPERTYRWRLANSPLYQENSAPVRAAESALMKAAGRALIPQPLVDALQAHAHQTRVLPRLMVSMPGTLSSIPVAFAGIDAGGADTRLVEIADIQALPSIGLTARATTRPADNGAAAWPLRVAGVFPAKDAVNAQPPSWAPTVIDFLVDEDQRKEQLRSALFADGPDAATAYLSGHLRPAGSTQSIEPLRSGLQITDNEAMTGDEAYLTVRDLFDSANTPEHRLPERILVLACSALGVAVGGVVPPATERPRPNPAYWPLAGEWVGFSAACLLTGARVVVCTHFDQVDDPKTTSMDHQITRMLEQSQDPVRDLSGILRCAISARRSGQPGSALTPMCYTIVTAQGPGPA